MVPIPSPVTCSVGGPVPGPCLLPAPVWLAHRLTGHGRVPAICRLCGSCETGRPLVRRCVHLLSPRLWSRLFTIGLSPGCFSGFSAHSLYRCWSPSASSSLAGSCTRSILLCLLTIILGPIAVPALVSHLRLVQVPRVRGCGRSCLVSLAVRVCLLGRLPSTGLLFLTIQDVVLARVLRFGAWMRIAAVLVGLCLGGCHNVVSE